MEISTQSYAASLKAMLEASTDREAKMTAYARDLEKAIEKLRVAEAKVEGTAIADDSAM